MCCSALSVLGAGLYRLCMCVCTPFFTSRPLFEICGVHLFSQPIFYVLMAVRVVTQVCSYYVFTCALIAAVTV